VRHVTAATAFIYKRRSVP